MSDELDTAEQTGPPAGRARRVPLGRDFGKLWTAAAFSNLADGLGRIAVPLDRDHADARSARHLGASGPWRSCRGSSSDCPPA